MSISLIHPTAIIDPSAELHATVSVGPYSIIGPHVVIGEGTEVGPHVVIKGPTVIGKNNKIYQFASVGEDCQDKKYRGEPTKLIIGDGNTIREFATVQRGTVQDNSETKIGDNNWFMAYVHIAHDCIIGSNTVFANNATVAGHVWVGDGVILGGFTGIHQFCKLGSYSFTSMFSAVNKDVPAYVMVQGNMARARGLNLEGMKRKNYSSELIAQIKQAYKIVYQQNLTLIEAMDALALMPVSPELTLFIDSLRVATRGITR